MPIDFDEFEEELLRNGMDPKPNWKPNNQVAQVGAAKVSFGSREAHLGVPPTYQPPLKASTPWDHHPEDAYEVPEHHTHGELYSAPETLKPVGLSDNQAAQLTAELVNMLASADIGAAPKDMVTLPNHYARFKIEPVRFSVENNLNFFQANIVKYILRYDAKNGMEDLRKARRYLDMFIKWVDGDPDWWRKPE